MRPDSRMQSRLVGQTGPPNRSAPEDAIRITFDPLALASAQEPSHDVTAGCVDLRIPGAADHLQSFAVRYASVLSPEATLLTDDDAIVVRRAVSPIDLADEPEQASMRSKRASRPLASCSSSPKRSRSGRPDGLRLSVSNVRHDRSRV